MRPEPNQPFLQNLERILEVATSIASNSSLETTLQKICQAIVELFNIEHSGLVLFAPDHLSVHVAAEYPSLGLQGRCIEISNIPFEADLIQNLQPIILENAAKNGEPLGEVGEILLDNDIQASLIVPVATGDEILASFSLDAIGHTYEFSAEQIKLCQVFAAQVAVAIKNNRLVCALEQQVQQLETIRQTALALTTITDPNKLLPFILEKAVMLLKGERGGIKVYDKQKNCLRIVANYGYEQVMVGNKILPGEGMAGKLLENGAPHIIVNDYPTWSNALGFAVAHLGAALSVPLYNQGDFWGVLYVDDALGRLFTEKDAKLLALFADHVAVALKNVDLIDVLNKQKERYEESLAHAPYGVIANKVEGEITVFNERAELMLGYSQAEMVGKQVHHVYATVDEVRQVNHLLATIGRFRNHKTGLKTKAGQIIPVNLSVTRVAESRTGDVEYVGYFEDLRVVQEQDRRLSLLVSASNMLTQAKSLSEGLTQIAEMMICFLDTSFCRIFLLDKDRELLRLSASSAMPTLVWEVGLGSETAVSAWPQLDIVLRHKRQMLLNRSTPDKRPLLDTCAEILNLDNPLQSLLVVPLRERAGDVVGLLDLGQVGTDATVTFSEQQINLAVAVAEQTAVLIDRFRLFEHTKLASERLRASFAASNALVSSRDPQHVLKEMVNTVCRVAKASGARMLRISKGTTQIELVATGSDTLDISQAVRDEGLTMAIWRSQQPQIVNDTRWEPSNRVNPSFFTRGIMAAAGLPVSVRGHSVGVLWVYFDQPRFFTDDELETLRLYVNQAAVAFDNSERLKALEQMRQAAEALSSAANIQDVLQQIVTHAASVLDADSAAIWSYDNQRQEFIANDSAQYGLAHELWTDLLAASPEAGGHSEKLITRDWLCWSEPLELKAEIPEAASEPYFSAETHALLADAGIRSFQSITLTVGQDKLGILFANYNHPRTFNEDERRAALTFGTHAALSLSKTKSLESLRHVNETAGLVASVATLAKLDETLDLIAENMQKAVNSDLVTLHIYHQDKKRLHYPAKMIGVQNETLSKPVQKPKSGTVQKVLAGNRDVWIVDNVTTHPLFGQSWFTEREGIHSTVAICLKMRDENVGALMVSYRTLHRFTSEELDYIDLFANQAAVAIHNAQLYEREQRQAVALLRLDKAAQAIANSQNMLEGIYFEITEQALHLTGTYGKTAHYGHLVTIQNNQIHFEACYPHASYSRLMEEVGLIDLNDEKTGIIGRAVQTAQTVCIHDVRQNPDYIPHHNDTTSELAVPIILNDDVIGVINVEHPDANAFDEHDVRALETLAEYAAIAIHNVRLYGRELKQASALDALYLAGNAVTRSLQRDEILQSLVEQAWHLVSYEERQINYASIWTAGEPLTSPTQLQLQITWPLEEIFHTQIALGGNVIHLTEQGKRPIGIVGQVFKTGKPLLVGNVSEHAAYLLTHPETRSELAVPMIWQNQIIGVINVESTVQHDFDDADQQALQSLAAQAVNALENARLYEEVDRHVKRLQAMAEITSQTLKILNETELLDKTVRLISHHLGFYQTAVFLKEPKGQSVVMRACSLANAQKLISEGHKLQIGKEGIIGHVMATGRPHLTPDVTKDEKHLAEPILAAIVAEMAFPLIVRGEVIGVLDIQHNAPIPTMLEEASILETMANQFASAIQNARLFQQTKRRTALLEAQYDAGQAITQSLEVLDIWHNIAEQGWQLIGPASTKAKFCALATLNGRRVKFEAAYPPANFPSIQATLGTIDINSSEKIGVTGRAIVSGKPQLVGDVAQSDDYLVYDTSARSNLAVPILIAGNVVGVIVAEHSEFNAFDHDDVETLRALAGHASIAWQNARKFEAAQVLQQAAADLTGLLDIYQILTKVMNAALALTDTVSAGLHFLDRDNMHFHPSFVLERPIPCPLKLEPHSSPLSESGRCLGAPLDPLLLAVAPELLQIYVHFAKQSKHVPPRRVAFRHHHGQRH